MKGAAICSIWAVGLLSGLAVAVPVRAEAAKTEKQWSGSVSLGYTETNGNTDKSAFSAAGEAARVFGSNKIKGRFDVYTAQTNDKLDDQKWEVLLKNEYSFGEDERWFLSQQLIADHDRFADIDVRWTPSAGLGYWLAREAGWKWNVEGGLAYESTRYRSSRDDDNSVSGFGRTYAEKKLFAKGKISEDFSIIHSLEGDGYRINSRTEFTNALTGNWELMVRYALDYDSNPSSDKAKTDTRLVTGLKYSF